jgi:hypothetical protein
VNVPYRVFLPAVVKYPLELRFILELSMALMPPRGF